jgi:hypothetical protein
MFNQSSQKPIRKRFVSQELISRDQALWICRAVLKHYRADGQANEGERDHNDIMNRVHKSAQFKRGRDWVEHPVGYDLKEVWYGSPQSGIREAFADLVSLPINRLHRMGEGGGERRMYKVFGLAQGNELTISVYRLTEVNTVSFDINYHNYVKQCVERLDSNTEEIPLYDPLAR